MRLIFVLGVCPWYAVVRILRRVHKVHLWQRSPPACTDSGTYHVGGVRWICRCLYYALVVCRSTLMQPRHCSSWANAAWVVGAVCSCSRIREVRTLTFRAGLVHRAQTRFMVTKARWDPCRGRYEPSTVVGSTEKATLHS